MASPVPPQESASDPETSPYQWRKVNIVDPRDPSGTIELSLLTRNLPPTQASTSGEASTEDPLSDRHELVTPVNLVGEDLDGSIVAELQVRDNNYPEMILEYVVRSDFFDTLFQSLGDEGLFYACYANGCTVIGTSIDEIQRHFARDHIPDVFDVGHVQSFRRGLPENLPRIVEIEAEEEVAHELLALSSGTHLSEVENPPETTAAENPKHTETVTDTGADDNGCLAVAGLNDESIPACVSPHSGGTVDYPISAIRETLTDSGRRLDGQMTLPEPKLWFGDERDGSIKSRLKKPPVPVTSPSKSKYFCICNQPRSKPEPKDGPPMVECSNKAQCFKRRYHLECIGMSTPPAADEEWFCDECKTRAIGNARYSDEDNQSPPALPFHASGNASFQVPSATGSLEAPPILSPPSRMLRQKTPSPLQIPPVSRSTRALRNRTPGGLTAPSGLPSTSDQVIPISEPSPFDLKPWSADLEGKFNKDSDLLQDFGVTTIDEAKAAVRARPIGPLEPLATESQQRTTEHDGLAGDLPSAANASTTSAAKSKKNAWRKPWSEHEQQALGEVMEEVVKNQNLKSHACWTAAHQLMRSRGINRPLGGLRMVWSRGLRERSEADERRKANLPATAPSALKATRRGTRGRGRGKSVRGRPARGEEQRRSADVTLVSTVTASTPMSQASTPSFPAQARSQMSDNVEMTDVSELVREDQDAMEVEMDVIPLTRQRLRASGDSSASSRVTRSSVQAGMGDVEKEEREIQEAILLSLATQEPKDPADHGNSV